MSATFEELRVLKAAEEVADSIWKHVVQWDEFARDVVGKQLAKAADSIGANIAESFGRFHFGEKLHFLYFSRGSLFETKYWLNRAKARALILPAEVENYALQLTDLARQLNSFANSLKTVRSNQPNQPKAFRELAADYSSDDWEDLSEALFSEADFEWLNS